MEDIYAFKLLDKELQSIQSIQNPPPGYDGIQTYYKKTTEVIDHAVNTTQKVARYGEAINAKLEEIQSALNQSTKKIEEQIKKAIDSIEVGTNSKQSSKDMEYMLMLQNLETKKQRLQEFIIKTQQILEKVKQGASVTNSHIEQLRGYDEANKQEQEDDEQRKKEETERAKEKEEDKNRKEDDNKKRMGEEVLRNKEEDELLKREEEDKHRNEEEIKQKEEIERKSKTEEEKKQRSKDPANWTPHTYRRSDGHQGTFHSGICCQVFAMPETLQEEDLECMASDEWRDNEGPTLAIGEKAASSLTEVKVIEGDKDIQVPIRICVPHCSVYDSSDEVIVMASIDGGEWTNHQPVTVPSRQTSHPDLNFAGIDVASFRSVKILAVAKTRSEEYLVDKSGISQASTLDKNIKIFVPRYTFQKQTKVKLEIRPIRDNSLTFATQYYDHCRNVLSTSSVMAMTCEAPTEQSIELDLTRNAPNDIETSDKRRHIGLYKCRGDKWKIAESEMKGNGNVTLKLPSRRDTYVVLEIEGRLGIPDEEFFNAADELCFHSKASIVRVIAKQRADNPINLMIQCVRRDLVYSRLSELQRMGYSVGPDTSKEFALIDGQAIVLRCYGTFTMTPESEVKLIFHAFMDTAKQEVTLQALNEYKYKAFEGYLGYLHFEVLKDNREGAHYVETSGTLPINIPKTGPWTSRAHFQFPHYQTTLAKFLAKKLTVQAKDGTWRQVIFSLGSHRDMYHIKRKAAGKCKTRKNECEICEITLHDWMKSRPILEDKIKLILSVLRECNLCTLSAECEKLVNIHKKYLSDECIREMAKKITNDWSSLARKLGLSEEDIASCKNDSDGSNEEKAFMMLFKWRVSEKVINTGLNVFDDLLGILETMQNFNDLKEYVRHTLHLISKD
ncbi:hypothetical protein ACJMK2_003021 [Sinanodonta woodiana]|uniref:Death domain-containing protein n=1 Tax=Sinanodonta woodiana TaxID=1069815 RepID=A0ABD3Y0B1_SINWO